ncbi:MAG: hypothetical protein AVDCRST_MAG11-798, partial [uncultured Gemmatimonadaceae bacterium]
GVRHGGHRLHRPLRRARARRAGRAHGRARASRLAAAGRVARAVRGRRRGGGRDAVGGRRAHDHLRAAAPHAPLRPPRHHPGAGGPRADRRPVRDGGLRAHAPHAGRRARRRAPAEVRLPVGRGRLARRAGRLPPGALEDGGGAPRERPSVRDRAPVVHHGPGPRRVPARRARGRGRGGRAPRRGRRARRRPRARPLPLDHRPGPRRRARAARARPGRDGTGRRVRTAAL